MKRPFFIIGIMVITAITALAGIFLAFKSNIPPPDIVFLNDAVMNAAQAGDISESANILTEQLSQAFEEMDSARMNRDRRLQIFLFLIVIILTITGGLLYLYCEKNILNPFRKLQGFARRIANGDFDIPLEMDKINLFGAFTESFDLMREELKKARENERTADRSKKELVASLSHDIKTPVASITAVTELMLIVAQNENKEKEIKQLETINIKAGQINSLITNMFHATLEELQALSVTINEAPSTAIADLVKNADYENRVKPFLIPNCLIFTDLLRLQQVFDNIIGNSYKYAGTDININAYFEENFLIVEIADFGVGVPEEELPLILNKFYRGKNTETKSGYGLGLYIAKYLLEQMSGDIRCENGVNGFCVKLILKLAG
ncbi:MAG: HAMP domain-containing histidine kinase [Lachnospiraceae bacterium]|nr:HAMP domain-containing histidine kinase [Lachnospiraceae bacterium]